MVKYFLMFTCCMAVLSCTTDKKESVEEQAPIRFMTLDPGHFHAALVQKFAYPEVDSTVYVYAPEGNDVKLHMDRIEGFNTRSENPTQWNSVVYTGQDFFEKMITEKQGNVVVLAGNNQKKTEYIHRSIEEGLNVLADKPMAINTEDFELLKQAFELAAQKDLLLYDIMTERYEITSILQRELLGNENIFGELEKGTPENPAVTKESVHHFYKYVAGNVLVRPPWFFDVEQEGEGVVDVTTHLVDLVQWQCFPEKIIDYQNDVVLNSARRWPTPLLAQQFLDVTKTDPFPEYLAKDVVNDTVLNVYCNGEINYALNGVHAKVSVIWNYKAPEGAGDTHFSTIRGSKANLVIRQGEEQGYRPVLYIEPVADDPAYGEALQTEFSDLEQKYPGISLEKREKGWEVIIPDSYKVGHEAHFAQVTEKFIEYLTQGTLPEWEVPNMIAKYYITTKALEMAKK